MLKSNICIFCTYPCLFKHLCVLGLLTYCFLLPWLFANPSVIDWWGHRSGDSGGADVSDEDQSLFQSVVHPQHLISPLGLLD